MKLKYHKIRNVPIDVCTAESKIAYELAFQAHISYQDIYNKAKTQDLSKSTIGNFISDVIRQKMRDYRNAYSYKAGRYNDDAIFCCLNAGLAKYFEKPFIASDYQQIGKAFPALYL